MTRSPARMLFAAAGGHGHLQPLLPLARQAQADGHAVLVSGAAALAQHVTAQGVAYAVTGPDLLPRHGPVVVHDLDHERGAIGRHFAGAFGRARAKDLIALCGEWRPDVIVRDEVDFGAAIAAEVLGLRHAAVVVLGAGGLILPEVARTPLEDLRAAFELPAEDGMAMLHRHLTLSPFPPSYRDPAYPLPGRVLAYRANPSTSRRVTADVRRVFVTLGTIFNTESGDLLKRMVEGIAACPAAIQVLVTTGPHIDEDELGRQPEHVTIRSFVPQDEALASCSAVVSHAGSGTVRGAIEHALPMVNLPLGADQPLNALRCQQLGLGLTLRADSVRAGDISAAVNTVLTDTSYRDAMHGMQDEWREKPDLTSAIRAVHELTE